MIRYKKGGLKEKTKVPIWVPPELNKKIEERARRAGLAKWVYIDWYIKSNESKK